MVISGRYFIQISSSDDTSYIEFEHYKWRQEAIHFSHLVVAIKLKLTETTIEGIISRCHPCHRYRLDIRDHESIIEVIRASEGAD